MGLEHCAEEIEHSFNKKHRRESLNLREKKCTIKYKWIAETISRQDHKETLPSHHS